MFSCRLRGLELSVVDDGGVGRIVVGASAGIEKVEALWIHCALESEVPCVFGYPSLLRIRGVDKNKPTIEADFVTGGVVRLNKVLGPAGAGVSAAVDFVDYNVVGKYVAVGNRFSSIG